MNQSFLQKRGSSQLTPLRKKEEGRVVILELLELPALANLLNQIRKENDSLPNSSGLAEVVSKDGVLASNVLKIANSPYFGLSQQVPSVPRAIVVLGFDAVKSIALSASIISALDERGGKDGFNRSAFWIHSLACAYVSRRISATTHLADLETSFACGLLHDIGKIALNIYFPESYRRARSSLSEKESMHIEAESEVLGFTHAEVGAWITQRCKFPKPIVCSVADHHGVMTSNGRYRELATTVRAANHLCLEEGLCLPGQIPYEPIEKTALSVLKLEREDLNRFRDDLKERKDRFISLFSNWDEP